MRFLSAEYLTPLTPVHPLHLPSPYCSNSRLYPFLPPSYVSRRTTVSVNYKVLARIIVHATTFTFLHERGILSIFFGQIEGREGYTLSPRARDFLLLEVYPTKGDFAETLLFPPKMSQEAARLSDPSLLPPVFLPSLSPLV